MQKSSKKYLGTMPQRSLRKLEDDCNCDVSKVSEVIGEYWESMWGGDTE